MINKSFQQFHSLEQQTILSMDRVDWGRVEKGSCMDDGSSMNDWVSNDGVSNDRVSNNRVDWCWWVCHSLVFDISNVTAIASSISGVVNDLDAAIR